MKGILRICVYTGVMLVAIFGTQTAANAQVVSNSGSITPPSSRVGADASPLTADNSMAITNSQEDADFRAFQRISPEQYAKKIKAGEHFLKQYTESSLRARVFAQLAVAYIQSGEQEKGFAAGSNAVQLNPLDVRTMGVLSQAIARVVDPQSPDASQKLDQAEKYGKQAVSVTPTLKKPEGLSEEAFAAAKDEALSLAYSGLGLVSVRRGKYADAIPELKQAVQLDPKKDPTNLYLLGVANQNSSHFADALVAFSECAELAGKLQPTCKSGADEARKRAGAQTSASAPK